MGNLSTDTGNGVFGPTFRYPFTVDIPGETGLGGLAVGSERFPLQDTLFVVPVLSSITPGLASYNILDPDKLWTFNVTAAVSSNCRNCLPQNIHPSCSSLSNMTTTTQYRTFSTPSSLTAIVKYPVPQPGNMSPRIDSSTTAQLALIGKTGPFSLYSAALQYTLNSKQVFGSSIDIVDEGSGAKAEFFKLFSIMEFF